MIKPKAGDLIHIYTIDKTEITGQVVEWGISEWGTYWSEIKDETETITININNISSFFVIKNEVDSYCIVNKDDEEKSRVVEAQKSIAVGYNIIKRGTNGEIEEISCPVATTRRLVKQGKTVIDEAPSEGMKLSLDPVERVRQQAEQHQKLSQTMRQSVQEHMNRKDLIKPKEVYALPSFKNRPKK
jgi:hypothetical protein